MSDLVPVDYDPFADEGPLSQLMSIGGEPVPSLSAANAARERAGQQILQALGPLGEAGMTVGDWLRTGRIDMRDIPQVAAGIMLGTAAPELDEAAPVEAAAAEATQGIRAFHGSPHDFDQFDISKIGTGEGAQAYGHGLYFAEEPAVARDYQRALAQDAPQITFKGQPITRSNIASIQDNPDLQEYLSNMLNYSHESPKDLTIDRQISRLRGWIENRKGIQQSNPNLYSLWERSLAALERNRADLSMRPAGRMYEVSINADPSHFLDWDVPLSEQTDTIRQLAQSHGLDTGTPVDPGLAWLSRAMGVEPEKKAPTGADLVRHLSGSRAEGMFDPEDVDPVEATKKLSEAGIPGIKYLDQGSRGKGRGSYNYVVFDPSIIDIIKKYGIAGLIAGGAAHFSTQPVDHDPFAE